MKFTLDAGSPANLIRGYSDTEVRVGTRSLHGSCIVTAETVIENWEPATFADLLPAHLEPILALAPELIVLGTGPRQQFPSTQIRALLAARRVGLEAMALGPACRTFNVLVQEERRVAAGLFLR
ncbi:MAG TPA: Mth938-like domain-containing protein [Steroidobacteraceae bacterium]|nr:Mth938-like domain-containing protein [Steroidobacteraceae bacterium]